MEELLHAHFKTNILAPQIVVTHYGLTGKDVCPRQLTEMMPFIIKININTKHVRTDAIY